MRPSRRITTAIGTPRLRVSQLVVVLGEPGTGKTRYALGIAAALTLSSCPIPVLFIAPGADKRALLRGLIQTWRPIRLPTIRARMRRLREAPLFIETAPRIGSIEMWLAASRIDRALQRRGTRLGLIIVDDLTHMGGRGYSHRVENLAALSRELGRFVIALSRPHPALALSLKRERVARVDIAREDPTIKKREVAEEKDREDR